MPNAPGRVTNRRPSPSGVVSCVQGYECCGVRFAVHAGPGTSLAAAAVCLPPGAVPIDALPTDPLFALTGASHDGDRPVPAPWQRATMTTPDTDVGRALFESALRFYVAVSAVSLVFVHAGVVGWQRRAIVVPGPSGSGKSTLVEALVRAGADYYSDEYAVIDRTGLVHSFPKPLTLVAAASTVKSRLDVREFGGGPGTRPLEIGLVAEVPYVPGASWEATPLTRAGCLLALLARTVRARIDPGNSLEVLGRSVKYSMGITGTRDAADAAAERILRLAEFRSEPEEGL